jgi:hypothetical protein
VRHFSKGLLKISITSGKYKLIFYQQNDGQKITPFTYYSQVKGVIKNILAHYIEIYAIEDYLLNDSSNSSLRTASV